MQGMMVLVRVLPPAKYDQLMADIKAGRVDSAQLRGGQHQMDHGSMPGMDHSQMQHGNGRQTDYSQMQQSQMQHGNGQQKDHSKMQH
jgi:hypothetical protein